MFSRSPICSGRGRDDGERVSVSLGEQSRRAFMVSGREVRWITFDEGHLFVVQEKIGYVVEFW